MTPKSTPSLCIDSVPASQSRLSVILLPVFARVPNEGDCFLPSCHVAMPPIQPQPQLSCAREAWMRSLKQVHPGSPRTHLANKPSVSRRLHDNPHEDVARTRRRVDDNRPLMTPAAEALVATQRDPYLRVKRRLAQAHMRNATPPRRRGCCRSCLVFCDGRCSPRVRQLESPVRVPLECPRARRHGTGKVVVHAAALHGQRTRV
jgi:hypothetical protein